MAMKKFCLLFVCLFCVGCLTPQETTSPLNPTQPIDKSMLTTLQLNMKSDPELANAAIKVEAKMNTVILSGTVPSEAAKAKAEAIAKKLDRVKEVDNQLEVAAPGP